MNNVNLIGRITKDIELRYTDSGLPAVSMFIAVNNGKDKEGNERPADFPKIVIYDKQAENLSKYCHKGSLVGITGKVKTRNWEKEDGTKGYETYVVANKVQFLESKKSESSSIPEPEYTTTEKEEKENNDPFADFGEQIDMDDNTLD